jgi:hypothetical protein
MSDKFSQNIKISGSQFIGNVGSIQGSQNIYNTQQQTLVKAASEIEILLKKLEMSYPINSTSSKMTVATEAINYIESYPELKRLILNSLKLNGSDALIKLLNHPVASFIVAALEDWQKDLES